MFVVKISGGIGNQFFQYFFARNLAVRNPEIPLYIDIEHYKKNQDHTGFELAAISEYPIWNNSNHSFYRITDQNIKNADFSCDLYFDGYWQSIVYIKESIDEIKSLIFKNLALSSKDSIALANVRDSTSVSIHVRRGDYINNSLHGNIANKAYFNNSIRCISRIIKKPYFFIFSDDIEWCKNNLNVDNFKCTYVDWTAKSDVRIDIFLMANCKHNIISNSSYSWWGQFLNQNIDKKVCAPQYWYNIEQDLNAPEIIAEHTLYICNVPINNVFEKKPFFSIVLIINSDTVAMRRCIASVLNQTFQNIELLCMDCGFNVGEILDYYASINNRLRVFSLSKCDSFKSLFSRVLASVKGKYVFFLNCDEWLDEETCAYVYVNINKCVDKVVKFVDSSSLFRRTNSVLGEVFSSVFLNSITFEYIQYAEYIYLPALFSSFPSSKKRSTKKYFMSSQANVCQQLFSDKDYSHIHTLISTYVDFISDELYVKEKSKYLEQKKIEVMMIYNLCLVIVMLPRRDYIKLLKLMFKKCTILLVLSCSFIVFSLHTISMLKKKVNPRTIYHNFRQKSRFIW